LTGAASPFFFLSAHAVACREWRCVWVTGALALWRLSVFVCVTRSFRSFLTPRNTPPPPPVLGNRRCLGELPSLDSSPWRFSLHIRLLLTPLSPSKTPRLDFRLLSCSIFLGWANPPQAQLTEFIFFRPTCYINVSFFSLKELWGLL